MSKPEYTLVVEVAPHFGATIEPVKLKLVKPKVTKVEGPYNEKDELLEYVEQSGEYYYYATLNVAAQNVSPKEIKWAVAYDDKESDNAFYLFSGKEIVDNRVKICINIEKAKEKFKIYAYTTQLPDKNVFVEVTIGNVYEAVFSGTKQWGKLQTGMATKNVQLSEEELDAGLDFVGKANVGIMKWMDEDTIKGFYEDGPLGVKAVLSDTDDIQNKVLNNFYTGNLNKLSFDETTQQSKKLKNLDSFQKYFQKYLEVILFLVKNEDIKGASDQCIIDTFNTLFGKHEERPNFSNKSEIPFHDYYGLMGGTQTVKVNIDIVHWIKKDGEKVDFYKIKTKMYIGDWYGADWGDVNGWESKLKGNIYSLNAFFWLQHHYGCHPFETEIIYESEDKIENKN